MGDNKHTQQIPVFKTEDETKYSICTLANFKLVGKKEDNNDIMCELCNATFRRPDHLKRHMQNTHTTQKYSVCPVCKEDLKHQYLLLKHLKKHSSTEIFHCRECEFECGTLTDLEKHEMLHTADCRHMCKYCKNTFKRRDHMLRHIKSKHFNQEVMCPECGQTYKRRDHVARHIREKHKMGFLKGKLVTSSDLVESGIVGKILLN